MNVPSGVGQLLDHVRQVERIEELHRQLDEAVDRYHDALLGPSAGNLPEAQHDLFATAYAAAEAQAQLFWLQITVAEWLSDEGTTDSGTAPEVGLPFRVVDQP